jgi:phospholipid/cholesterol/gamma-HCH transport system ATP-binding protein
MPKANVPEIEFRNVSMSFDEVHALTDVSFKLERDEMIFLTGVSGSGKSVLLHLAIALVRPDEGQIFIKGEQIENLKEEALLAVRGGLMGMAFQEDSLFSGMTVFDNIAYRLEEHEWDEARIESTVAEALHFVGLEGEENKYPEELSGGMKRRVEIARAMIGWPSIMLFDEPTLSLDPINAAQVLDLILRARDINKVSSLYVTKKLSEIPYLAGYRASRLQNGSIEIEEAPTDDRPKSRVLVLDAGQLIFDGSVDGFLESDIQVIKDLRTLDHHDHSRDPYFTNPWDKSRRAKEEIL